MWYNVLKSLFLETTMAENTLDDLILTDSEPEKGKSKGVLALLALVILLIIVGAILAKMIFSAPEDLKGKKNDTDNSVATATVADTNSANNTTANSILQPLDPDLAPLDDSNASMAATTQTLAIDEPKKGTQTAAHTPAVAKKIVEEQPKKEHKIGHATTQKSPTKVHHPKPQHTKKTYGGSGNVYIQVGSFKQGPKSDFISKIRKAGFKFRIKETDGYRRVYVGPFKTRQEAKSLLGIVKSKIAPNAFVK